MSPQEALRIVYELGSQNALDLDHQDAELRIEASRQDDAIDVVYTMLTKMEQQTRVDRLFALVETFTVRLTELAHIDTLSQDELDELGHINYFREMLGELS